MAYDFAKAMHRSRVLSGAARLVGCSGALAALSLVFFPVERHDQGAVQGKRLSPFS